MKKLLLSAAALIIIFAACSKDDDKNTPQTPAKKYLLNMTSSEDSVDMTYDAAYSMKTIFDYTLYDKSTVLSEFVYENGKPTRKMNSVDGEAALLSQVYEYNSAGKLLKVNHYTLYNGFKSHYDSLAYDANGRLTAVYEHVPDNDPDVNSTYHIQSKLAIIWDDKGNVIRTADVSGPEGAKDSVITDFTYDDKVNFASRQPEFFLQKPINAGFGLSANNVIKSVNRANSDPQNYITTTKEYTYDEDGYPVTQKEVEKVMRGTVVASTREDNFKYRYIKK